MRVTIIGKIVDSINHSEDRKYVEITLKENESGGCQIIYVNMDTTILVEGENIILEC